MAETTQSAFRRNAQAALQDGTFEDILSALVMKLRELGVLDENAAEEAHKNYEPLARAFSQPRDQEVWGRAWDNISARIFQLGSLLPPEALDGAFLADRTQVKALLDKRTELCTQKVVAEMHEEHTVVPSHADERDEAGDGGAGPLEGGIFEMSLDKTRALIWSFYTGRAPSEYQPSPTKSQEAPPEAEALEATSAVASTAPSTSGDGSQPVVSQTASFGVMENADADSLEQLSTHPILGRPQALIKKARMLAQRAESLRAEDIIDLSGYRRDKELGDAPNDVILTGGNPKMPVVRVNGSPRGWISNLVYSRLSQVLKLSVLQYAVAAHAPAEVKADNLVVVCPYFMGWLPLEEWQKMPMDESVEINNSRTFFAHLALELLVDTWTNADDATFGYVLPSGIFLRNPSRHSFGPFYIGLALNGQDEHWRGMYHGEVDAPPPQLRWNDYRKSIDECNASPPVVAVLLRNLAALTDADLISCVRLPDFPHRERVQSILLSRLLRIRKTARNYMKKVHELADQVAEG